MIKVLTILEEKKEKKKKDLDILNYVNMSVYSIHQFNKPDATQPNLNMLLHYSSLL